MSSDAFDPERISESVRVVRSRISAACERAGRDSADVTLIGASKTVPADVVQLARGSGVADFAENYVRELREKAARVDATWHFIGKLQTGSVRHVAELADVVHSAEPGRAVVVLARRAAASGRTIDALVEVDFTEGRQGTRPQAVAGFVEELSRLNGLRVIGLMTVPPPTPDPRDARPFFARLCRLREGLRDRFEGLRHLSMGMSADYEVAIEEGATMVRIGTALFGARPAHAASEGLRTPNGEGDR